MNKINRRFVLKSSVAALTTASFPKWSAAQTAAYTADDLKGTLTPFGAIRAGNASGTIPAWTGGYSEIPTGYQPGDPIPNPFKDEQALFSLTSENISQYEDKISSGATAMFQKKPGYRMDVYTTHRTACAPQYVYDYIYKNASTAQLTNSGNSVTGAYGGIPFPIPKNGYEVMWNHLLAWYGTTLKFQSDAYTVTNAGEIVLETTAMAWVQFPYYFENGESDWNGVYLSILVDPSAPPYEAGALIAQRNPVNQYLTPVQSWIYLQGERRVRSAPELQYDTPNSLTGGTVNWDENNIFFGQLNEYDCTYQGVKEMYVPYNTNKGWLVTPTQQLLPHFMNPDFVRWELHRVRVVEMTVKQGSRNVDARRIVYCDEDTGSAIMGEVYDAQGSLWKFQHMMPAIMPQVPCIDVTQFFITYDLHSGVYSVSNSCDGTIHPQYEKIHQLPDSFFSPGQIVTMAGGL
jgi:hypothetical protein